MFSSDAAPTPCVTIAQYPGAWQATLRSLVTGFRYGSVRITGTEPSPTVFDQETLTVHHRDFAFEAASRARLRTHGAKEEWDSAQGTKTLVLPANRLGPMVLDLVGAGWHVDTDGADLPSRRLDARSRPIGYRLVRARRRRAVRRLRCLAPRPARGTPVAARLSIVLSDGSHGVLPLDWLALLGPVAGGGKRVDGITALQAVAGRAARLAARHRPRRRRRRDVRPRARRAALVRSRRPRSIRARTFVGTLREYQREGLGWLHFLRRFQLGGCLADDMGLGKTVQVLALLDSRRETRAPGDAKRPSLVVVPRSLVFNWIREAAAVHAEPSRARLLRRRTPQSSRSTAATSTS